MCLPAPILGHQALGFDCLNVDFPAARYNEIDSHSWGFSSVASGLPPEF